MDDFRPSLRQMRTILGFYKVPEVLRQFTIEITQKCNSRCIFCSSGSSPDTVKHTIPIEKLTELSDFAASKGLKVMNISGGEPFIHPDLVSLIQHNIKNGLVTNVYSSGNFSDAEFARVLDAKISPAYLKFTFNYQSSDETIFQRLTNAAPFSVNDVHRRVIQLLDMGYNLGAHIVPNKINFDTLYESVRHLRDMGISQIGLLRMVAQERALDNKDDLSLEPDPYIIPGKNYPADQWDYELVRPKVPKELVETLKKIRDLQTPQCRIKVGVPFENKIGNGHVCEAGMHKMVVRYDGRVFPCEAFKGDAIRGIFPWLDLGSIYTDSLDKIWENGVYAFCSLRSDTSNLPSAGVWPMWIDPGEYLEIVQDVLRTAYDKKKLEVGCHMNDRFRAALARVGGFKVVR